MKFRFFQAYSDDFTIGQLHPSFEPYKVEAQDGKDEALIAAVELSNKQSFDGFDYVGVFPWNLTWFFDITAQSLAAMIEDIESKPDIIWLDELALPEKKECRSSIKSDLLFVAKPKVYASLLGENTAHLGHCPPSSFASFSSMVLTGLALVAPLIPFSVHAQVVVPSKTDAVPATAFPVYEKTP